ncbi:adenylate/guanylate cyclase domain-containing protein [Kordia jejudonensis]|uniref:adenylate/guanylate cyclase domain-containing protein n=1 Tax=Kordia jejudonensis TaxID=1348245 RepID=UPI0006291AE4|nr:adenylate/guanylate cyclase domain-containing protein [Kordia jejudonensis]
MLSPQLKRNIARILPFGIIWLLFGIIFLTVEFAATKDYEFMPDGVINLSFKIVVFAMIAVTFVGFLIGTIELLFLNRYFSRSSFLIKIIGKIIIYSLFLFLIICIMYPIAASIELETNIFDPKVWNKFLEYLTNISFLSTVLQMAVSLGASLFYSEISENIGHGILVNIIRGKYHKPKEEDRIFMFLDMKSSTTIAEKLGHTEYFKLLKEYYNILSEAVIKHSGEIYQYVGDEMVISWNYKNGIAKNNCIHCFFDMKKDLQAKQDWFQATFKMQLSFKAGIHLGTVTTGEIGSLKKDIIFTGDVLNATARIQSLCNTIGVDILISKELHDSLQLEEEFQTISVGNKELRGKLKTKELYTILQSI